MRAGEGLRGGTLASAGDRDPAALPWEFWNVPKVLMPYLRLAVHLVVSMLVMLSVLMTLHYSSYSSIDSDD